MSKKEIKTDAHGNPNRVYNGLAPVFKGDKVEITKTQLRGLMFWAETGIARMQGGSYESTVDFIRDNAEIMGSDISSYRKLCFGRDLLNRG